VERMRATWRDVDQAIVVCLFPPSQQKVLEARPNGESECMRAAWLKLRGTAKKEEKARYRSCGRIAA
jgi:hypothetical protein